MTRARTILLSTTQCLLALLLVLAVASTALSQSLDKLKREVSDLKEQLSAREKEVTEAKSKLDENIRAQGKATGSEQTRLKREGTGLANSYRKALEARDKVANSLASKRGQVRTKAEEVVRQELDKNKPAQAETALKDWEDALADLPPLPTTFDTQGNDLDDEELEAIKKADRARFDDYIGWAKEESDRLGEEIKALDAVIKREGLGKLAGGKQLIDKAKAMRKKVEERKQTVDGSRKKAEATRDTLR